MSDNAASDVAPDPVFQITPPPPVRCKLYIIPNSENVVFHLTAEYPGWWHRFWHRFLLGWRYERVQ